MQQGTWHRSPAELSHPRWWCKRRRWSLLICLSFAAERFVCPIKRPYLGRTSPATSGIRLTRSGRPFRGTETLLACAQVTSTAKELAGAWVGTLKINDQTSFRLALRVEGGKAVIDSLDQGVKDIEVNTLSYDKGKVRLESQPIQATFKGDLDEKKGEITGTRTQPGGSWPLTLAKQK